MEKSNYFKKIKSFGPKKTRMIKIPALVPFVPVPSVLVPFASVAFAPVAFVPVPSVSVLTVFFRPVRTWSRSWPTKIGTGKAGTGTDWDQVRTLQTGQPGWDLEGDGTRSERDMMGSERSNKFNFEQTVNRPLCKILW